MTNKPIIDPDGRSSVEAGIPEIADLPDNEIANRARRSGGPYIPGYSEEEAARDIAQGERFASAGEIHGLSKQEKEEYYRRFGTDPKPKTRDLKFLRVAGANGQSNMNVKQRMVGYRRDGYEVVDVEDFEEGGPLADYDIPPDAEVATDGTIRRIDTALFWKPVDADRDEDRSSPERASPLDQIPEKHRIIEDEREGSKAVSYPTN